MSKIFGFQYKGSFPTISNTDWLINQIDCISTVSGVANLNKVSNDMLIDKNTISKVIDGRIKQAQILSVIRLYDTHMIHIIYDGIVYNFKSGNISYNGRITMREQERIKFQFP